MKPETIIQQNLQFLHEKLEKLQEQPHKRQQIAFLLEEIDYFEKKLLEIELQEFRKSL